MAGGSQSTVRDGAALWNFKLKTFHRAGKLLSSCSAHPAGGNHPPGREKLHCPWRAGKVGPQDDIPVPERSGGDFICCSLRNISLQRLGQLFLPLSPKL